MLKNKSYTRKKSPIIQIDDLKKKKKEKINEKFPAFSNLLLKNCKNGLPGLPINIKQDVLLNVKRLFNEKLDYSSKLFTILLQVILLMNMILYLHI